MGANTITHEGSTYSELIAEELSENKSVCLSEYDMQIK